LENLTYLLLFSDKKFVNKLKKKTSDEKSKNDIVNRTRFHVASCLTFDI
jgi:hypothetical protein